MQCMLRKSEVYTWRLSPSTKAALEETARQSNRSVAELLDEIVVDHLASNQGTDESEMAHQRRLHSRAARFAGCFAGDTTARSERARELVRLRLKRRQARAR